MSSAAEVVCCLGGDVALALRRENRGSRLCGAGGQGSRGLQTDSPPPALPSSAHFSSLTSLPLPELPWPPLRSGQSPDLVTTRLHQPQSRHRGPRRKACKWALRVREGLSGTLDSSEPCPRFQSVFTTLLFGDSSCVWAPGQSWADALAVSQHVPPTSVSSDPQHTDEDAVA